MVRYFSKLSIEKKSAIVFVLATAITSGLNMVTTPLFTRIMPVSDFGVVQLYNTWYQVLFVLGTFSVTNAVVNVGFKNNPDDRIGYLASSIGFSSACTLFLGVLYIAFKDSFAVFSGLNESLVFLIFLSFLLLTPTQLWLSYQRYELKYKWVFIIVVSTGIISTLVSLICVYYADSNFANIRLWSMNILQLCVGAFFYVFIVFKGKRIFDRYYWKFILFFNAPLLMHYLSQFILGSSDRLMIEHFCGEEKVAVYSLGYLVSNILLLVFTPINAVIIPKTHKLLDELNYKEIESLLYKILIGCGIVIFLISLLSPEIIYLLGGVNYKDGAFVIPVVACSTLFTITYLYIANIEFLYGKTYRIAVFTFFAAFMNVLLNAILIPRCGFIAAGYTTLVSYVIYSLLHLSNMKRLMKNNLFSGWKLHGLLTLFLLLIVSTSFFFDNNAVRYSLLITTLFCLFLFRNLIIKIIKL